MINELNSMTVEVFSSLIDSMNLGACGTQMLCGAVRMQLSRSSCAGLGSRGAELPPVLGGR